MINKYGNDFKNNIFWNKEYPFIPEVTNDAGFTIHEGDIVDYCHPTRKTIFASRVYKIYDSTHIWICFIDIDKRDTSSIVNASMLVPYTSKKRFPNLSDFDNKNTFNDMEHILSMIYYDKYKDELCYENDWHFDPVKVDAKRLEEVAKIKCKN